MPDSCMMNVWTKYGEPRLYDKGESDLKSRKLRINLTMSVDSENEMTVG